MEFWDNLLVAVVIIGCCIGLLVNGLKYYRAKEIKEANKRMMLIWMLMIAIASLMTAKMIAHHHNISIIGIVRDVLNLTITGKEMIFIIVAAGALLFLDWLIKRIKKSRDDKPEAEILVFMDRKNK